MVPKFLYSCPSLTARPDYELTERPPFNSEDPDASASSIFFLERDPDPFRDFFTLEIF